MLLACAWAGVGSELLRDGWLLASGRFDPAYMLPFHLCGVMLFVEFWAVLRRGPLALELCYCAGLPGALGALLTPGETSYPFWNLMYWQFIFAHAMLFLTPVLLLCGGFRPHPKRLPACFTALLGFALAAAAANAAFGGNYMFLRAAPPGSALELLAHLTGGYYQIGMAAMVLLFWAGLYLPWKIYTQRSTKRAEGTR